VGNYQPGTIFLASDLDTGANFKIHWGAKCVTLTKITTASKKPKGPVLKKQKAAGKKIYKI